MFVLPRIKYEKGIKIKWLYSFIVAISTVALLLTFSRTAIMLLICFYIYQIYIRLKSRVRIKFLMALIFAFLIALIIFPKEFLFRGINFREELLSQSASVFMINPVFGVGINNFFIAQIPLIDKISAISFQPPHNIYVLWLIQFGILGFLILPYLLYLAYRAITQKLRCKNVELKDFNRSILFVLIAIVLVGIFDHFFLTVEQGQLMFALILGLSFVNYLGPEVFKIRKSKGRK